SQLAFSEFQQAAQSLADLLLSVGRTNCCRLRQETGGFLCLEGFLYEHLEEEIAAVQLVEPTAEQKAAIDRAYSQAQQKCTKDSWYHSLTEFQQWGLDICNRFQEQQEIRGWEQREREALEKREAELGTLLGPDCPPRQRMLFQILCFWFAG